MMNQNPGSVHIVVNEDGGRNPEKQFAKRPAMILSAMQIILGRPGKLLKMHRYKISKENCIPIFL